MPNVAIALQVLLQIISQVQSVAGVISTAQSQNRDVTDDELNTLVTGYAQAKASLDALIASKGG